MRFRILLIVLFLFPAIRCLAQESTSTLPKAPYVSIETAKNWVAKKRDLLFVDVRRPDEYKAGHLPGAVNIPYDQVEDRKKEIPLDKPVIFYCTQSTWRAPYAANVMADAGWNNVYVLEGGASAWNAGGQQIVASDSNAKGVVVPKPTDLKPNFKHAPNRIYKTPINLTVEQLKEFDGKNGRPAFVAVDGVIYDLTLSRLWRGGEHNPSKGEAYAGRDLSDVIKDSPHGIKHLKEFPVVGHLIDSKRKSK